MKILIVASGFPNINSLDGLFEYDQAKALAALGHDVYYVGIDLHSFRKKRKYGFSRMQVDDITVFTADFPVGRIPFYGLALISAFCLQKIYANLKSLIGENVDVVHAHFGLIYGYGAVKLCKKERLPLFITEHSSHINKNELSICKKKILAYVYGKAQKVIAVSSALGKKIYIHTNINSVIIPNIVSVSEFSYNPIKYNGFRFVAVGNLISIKRMGLLCKLFCESFKGDLTVTLTIFGDGPEYDQIQSYIEQQKLCNQIFLEGRKTRKEIADFYNKADCFVLLSLSETFGVAYIEAMASGLPVIATKCGGPNDFVNDSNGILIDKIDDEQLMKEALQQMLLKRFDHAAISQKTRLQFSPRKIAEKLSEEYCR